MDVRGWDFYDKVPSAKAQPRRGPGLLKNLGGSVRAPNTHTNDSGCRTQKGALKKKIRAHVIKGT